MKSIVTAFFTVIAAVCAFAEQSVPFVRVNQVGYAARAPKVAVVVADGGYTSFSVECLNTPDIRWRPVLSGALTDVRQGYRHADFSAVTTPGDYRVVCSNANGMTASYAFQIRDDVYEHLERILFEFYTWQRCGHKKGWAGVCHQDSVPLKGTDRFLDMRGGHHQSCDLRTWGDDSARMIWLLYRWAEKSSPCWDDGIVEEELRWGTDYFVKLVGPEGWAYDCQFEPIGWGPRNYYLSPAPLTAQGCVLHVLASAARRFRVSDPAYARTCLAKARTVFDNIETNDFFTRTYAMPCEFVPGAQPEAFYRNALRDNANGWALRISSAYELYSLTGERRYLDVARACGEKLLCCQIASGKNAGQFKLLPDGPDADADLAFGSGCCGGRNFGLLALPRLCALTDDVRYEQAFRRLCDAYVRAMSESLDEVKGPGTMTSRALALMEGYRRFGNPEYRRAAQRGIDWVLGVNRRVQTLVNGVGYNHGGLRVYGQFFPSTPWIPGATAVVLDGEYNLPNAAELLVLAHELNQ